MSTKRTARSIRSRKSVNLGATNWDWHYDLRPTINGVKLYVETRLYPESFSSRHDPIIQIVQIKVA